MSTRSFKMTWASVDASAEARVAASASGLPFVGIDSFQGDEHA